MQWSAVLLESDASLALSCRQQAADSACLVAVQLIEKQPVSEASYYTSIHASSET